VTFRSFSKVKATVFLSPFLVKRNWCLSGHVGECDRHKRWFSNAVSTNAVILNFHAEATATEHLHEGYEVIEEDNSTLKK